MKRIDIVLRAGVALCGARRRRRPPRRRKARCRRRTSQTPAATAAAEPVARAARSSSPARASAAIRSTRTRRSSSSTRRTSHKTGLNSINDVLQRLPSSGGGLNSKFNNSGNLGNPPDGGGVGAGAAEIDLRYLGSRRMLVLVDGLRYVNGASAQRRPRLGRPQLHSRKHDRARRGAAGRRLGDLRLGRDRRRGQHHHQEAARRASTPPRSSAAISTRATASPRITS